MRKIVLLLSLFLTLGLCAKETIKIGVILPMTGSSASSGQDTRDALILAEKELAQKSLKYDYKIIFEDSQNTPRLAAEAFKKLSEIDKIDVALSFASGPGSAISPIAGSKKILHIGAGYSTAIAAGSLNFNVGPMPHYTVTKGIEFLRALGIQRVAFISMQHAGNNAVEEEFLKQIAGTEIKITAIQKFNPGERDFRVAILKVRDSQPQIVFIQGFDPEAPIILRQMGELGWQVPVSAMGVWSLFNHKEFWGIPYVDPATNPEYSAALKKSLGRAPSIFPGFLRDALMLYVESAESYTGPGKPSAEFIAGKLQAVRDYDGITGKLTPDAEGWFSGPMQMVMMTDDGVTTGISMDEAVKHIHDRWPASSVAK